MSEAFVLNVSGFQISGDYLLEHTSDVYTLGSGSSVTFTNSYRLLIVTITASVSFFSDIQNSAWGVGNAYSYTSLCKPGQVIYLPFVTALYGVASTSWICSIATTTSKATSSAYTCGSVVGII